jgi:guanine deaminase
MCSTGYNVAHHTDRTPACTAHRGALLHFLSDPGAHDDPASFEFIEDGLLLINDGLIAAIGPASALLSTLPADMPVIEHGDNILLPGFIDTHIHYPQTDVIAAGGRQVLDWLENYTFPVEGKFADAAHATEVAEFFLDELARNGTTTAMVFGTVHKISVDSFFTAASKRQLRMIAGKVLMDRNCPAYLRDSAVNGERESRELLETWHRQQRLLYAITPRFAPTSSVAQLQAAGRLARQFPDAYIHSHLAESRDEVAWVRQLFPDARSYLDVYEQYGLLRERALYAHCIHLDATDRARMAATGASAAFCPTSNLYLGSGLFDIAATDDSGMRFAIATDVGGGTSFSMLRTLSEAYKVAQLLGQRLSPLRAFYLATLGGARCLGLDHCIGRFAVGNEADFIVLDRKATPLMARRCASASNVSETLLILMTLGDDRAIAATYIMGQPRYRKAVSSNLPLNRN